jgi:hypothetical protein
VKLGYELYSRAGALLLKKTPDAESGTVLVSRVDKSLALAEGVYRWRAQTVDEFTSGDWSAYCWFQVDTTPPEPADVVQVTVDPVPGDEVRFNLVGGGDVAKFQYILGPEANGSTMAPRACTDYTCHLTVNATDGKATINILPSSATIDHTCCTCGRSTRPATSPPAPTLGSPTRPPNRWSLRIGCSQAGRHLLGARQRDGIGLQCHGRRKRWHQREVRGPVEPLLGVRGQLGRTVQRVPGRARWPGQLGDGPVRVQPRQHAVADRHLGQRAPALEPMGLIAR